MQILITGAAGFIGQLLTTQLLSAADHKLILIDVIDPPIPTQALHPKNATSLKVDLCDAAAVKHAIVTNCCSSPGARLDAVFVFHGIMSSGAEHDFEAGMRANVDATRNLLDALRSVSPSAGAGGGGGDTVRVIYASSLAVYGGPLLPAVVDDRVIPTPQSSYGAEKLMCEVLVNEYSRRSFIDGLSLRFPTVSVRAGKPTGAASSFLSGMIREPLSGLECVVPMVDRGFESWLCSPRVLVGNLVHALAVPTVGLPGHVRQMNLPGICVTVQEMRDALEEVGGKDKLGLLREEADPALLAILKSWPTRFDNSQAISLGFKRDESFLQAVRDYKESL